MTKTVEIYFDDLIPETQEDVLKAFGKTMVYKIGVLCLKLR
jgi:hypothetical protein